MFKLADGRKHLYQWDRDIKLLAINEEPIDEIHFCIDPWDRPYRAEIKISDGCMYAIIPNTLLRQNKPIYAMPYCKTDNGIYTKYKQKFEIIPRSQPEDYINPDDEEDLKIWEDLNKRLIDIEENGINKGNVEEIVKEVLEENPTTLPVVREEDNGKVLMVVDGAWKADNLPSYDGAYEISPSAYGEQTLHTAQKFMDSDVTVKKISYAEVSNNSNGTTIYIGSEV